VRELSSDQGIERTVREKGGRKDEREGDKEG
jgi:hypothetical protein